MAALAVFLGVGGGCGGRVPPDSAGGGGSIAGGGGGTAGACGGGWCPPTCDPEATSFAPARIWQLTDEQYVNVVRDVLGIALAGADAEITGPASNTGEYANDADGGAAFTDATAVSYESAAERVASLATVSDRMAALVGSSSPTEERIEEFVSSKVARLWRRPLGASEASRLVDLYRMGAVDGSARGLELVIETALQAPAFLYRTELGAPGAATTSGAAAMTVYEQASALAFLFTNSAPDDELWQKAANGTLADPSVLGAEVDRLLSLPATQNQLVTYASYWLSIEKIPTRERDPTVFPQFDGALRRALYDSGRAFVKDVVLAGSLTDLLASSKVFVNDAIGDVYGLSGARGPALVPVTIASPERSSGLLTQPSLFVAASRRPALTDPVHRGLFVLDNLLCGGDAPEILPPPADALSIAAKMMGNERELAEQRIAEPKCAPCHTVLDPFGLTMERYDAIGRYAAAVDASSTMADSLGPDLKGRVDGVAELAERLASGASRRRVAYCAGKWLSRYALGHDTSQDNGCALQQVKERFFKSGSFVQFYKDLATSPGFASRRRP